MSISYLKDLTNNSKNGIGAGEGEVHKEGNSPSCPAAAVFSFLSLNCNRLSRTYMIKKNITLEKKNNMIQLLTQLVGG